jgi:hypothetical protein
MKYPRSKQFSRCSGCTTGWCTGGTTNVVLAVVLAVLAASQYGTGCMGVLAALAVWPM